MPKKTSTLRIQTAFSKPTEKQIRKCYNMQEEERLLCEIRFAGQCENSYLLTERTLYWTGENRGTETLFGSLPRHDITELNLHAEAAAAKNEAEQPDAGQIQSEDAQAAPEPARTARSIRIQTGTRTIELDADFLTQEDAAILADILQKYIAQDAAFEQSILPYTENKISGYARTAADWFRCGHQTAGQYIHKARSKTDSFLNETKKEAQAAAEAGKKKTVSFFTVLGHTIRHIFDLAADLIFAAAVIIAGKPNLADNLPQGMHLSEISIGTLFRLDSTPLFWFCILLAVFIIIKLIVLFSCSRGNKGVSILLLVLTVLSCLLIQTQILLFVLFFVLLYLSFQLSCRFSASVIKAKLLFLILLVMCLYTAANVILNDTVRYNMQSLMKELRFPDVPSTGIIL